jgi:hypothetical protein
MILLYENPASDGTDGIHLRQQALSNRCHSLEIIYNDIERDTARTRYKAGGGNDIKRASLPIGIRS